MFRRFIHACAATVLAGSVVLADNAAQTALPQAMQVEVRQGEVFRFVLPSGWDCNETASGVDMTRSDGLASASHLFFHGWRGQSSPDQMMGWLKENQRAFGIAALRVLDSKALAPNCKIYLTSFTSHGRELRGMSIFGATNLPFGGYFTESLSIQAPPESFQRDAQLIIQVAASVTCTSPSEMCGADRVMYLQPSLNHPDAGGDPLMSSWEYKNRSGDRSAQKWSDAMLGVDRWGAGRTQYIAPSNAKRVFVAPGGAAYYLTDWTSPPPPNTSEIGRTH